MRSTLARIPVSRWVRWPGRSALVLLAVLVPVFFVLVFAAAGPQVTLIVFLFACAMVACARDLRFAVMVAVGFASFIEQGGGRLTIELSILLFWMTGIAIVLWWRSAWKGWRPLPSEVATSVLVWLGVCGFGAVHGLVQGNSLRFGALELFYASWPLMALLVSQLFGRRSVPYALIGLAVIALGHSAFGLTMLKAMQQRLGGVYFTPVTGLVAVILWTTALLIPSRWIQIACLAIIVPLLLHLFFSFTRGYWLGYLAGFAVTSALAAWTSRQSGWRAGLSRLKVPAGFFAGLLLVSWLAMSYLGESDLLQSAGKRFGTSFDVQATGETASNMFRLVEYDEVIQRGRSSPLVGWGFGYTIDFRDPIFRTHEMHWFIHNYYLLTWLKLGVVGLLAFFFLIFQTLLLATRMMIRDRDPWVKMWAIATIGVTVDLMVISFTHYPLATENSAVILAFVWGMLWGMRSESPAAALSHRPAPLRAGA